MTEPEWREAYKKRIIEKGNLLESDALECVEVAIEAGDFADNPDDPVHCADEEMSYWDNDE